MVTIRLTNTKTRRKEDFQPIDPLNVRMYVCGPTVYDRAHLGNARPVVVFDVLNRLLRHVYGADHVTYVRNFTDVDDKINAEALRRQKAGAPGTLEALIHQRTEETIAWYHADMDALGALRPAIKDDRSAEGMHRAEPRATEFVAQMVTMIEGLITSGHAYEAAGHVLFRVRSYKDYGKLSGRSIDDMIAGARVEVAPFKEDPMDFVLWKPSSGEEPGWDSPWGKGRPGWHIECSAMAHELLGESFDIHGGGLDLQFPHHENEIAQSACAHPHGDFAHYWLHNEMLQVEGKKMSKSLGNFFTVRDLLDQGIPGEVIRYVFLMTHYRSPMDWTERKRQEVETRLERLLPAVAAAIEQGLAPSDKFEDLPDLMRAALTDDLNTSAAVLALEGAGQLLVNLIRGETVPISQALPKAIQFATVQFLSGLSVLGLFDLMVKRHARRSDFSELLDKVQHRFVVTYASAKQTKHFSAVDTLKSALMAAGVEVRMSKDGVELVPGPGFDPAKLKALK